MLTAWQFDHWDNGKETNNWQKAIQTIDESRDVLDAIHAALQKPEWDGGFDYDKGLWDFQVPALVHFKLVSRILSSAAACELKQGRTNEAVERLNDAIRMVKLQKDERLIISQLVRIACATVVWNSTWGILQMNACSETQLAQLQVNWQDMDFSSEMAAALEMERAMTLDLYSVLSNSRRKAALYFEQQEEAAIAMGEFSFLPTRGVILHLIHFPLWRNAWARQDARRALDRWQDLIEVDRIASQASWIAATNRAIRLDEAGSESPWLRMGKEKPKQNIYNRWRYLLSNQTFGVGSSLLRRDSLLRRVVEIETTRRMMVTALALRRHQLKHGKVASTLDALVPELLPAVPVDGMDGKPLRYQPNPDGTFLLYSVGEDGKDDGGDSSLAKGRTKFSQIWDGKDALWPAPATAEEASRAIGRN